MGYTGIISNSWKGGICNKQKMKELAKKWNCTIKEAKERLRQIADINIIQTAKETINENNFPVY